MSNLIQTVPHRLKNPPLTLPTLQKEITFPYFLTSYKESFFLYFCARNFDYKPDVAFITVIHTEKPHLVKITSHPPLPFNPNIRTTNFTIQEN